MGLTCIEGVPRFSITGADIRYKQFRFNDFHFNTPTSSIA
jgi:hypothetical protein